ncbi:unnamed protein product [Cylicocyclus nassatus]|uniref:Uncharacterized protein n=1 Tax=Cylicocyclus nassatus TaxID=53992 RepID=A0AA36H4X2_CYLNA|nr:unnamed protein product [Cylicocyclus nassatus]
MRANRSEREIKDEKKPNGLSNGVEPEAEAALIVDEQAEPSGHYIFDNSEEKRAYNFDADKEMLSPPSVIFIYDFSNQC